MQTYLQIYVIADISKGDISVDLVGPSGPLWAGPLWAGQLWAPPGPLWAGHLWPPLGPCRPPWALADGLAPVAPTIGRSPRDDRPCHRNWIWLWLGQLHDDRNLRAVRGEAY